MNTPHRQETRTLLVPFCAAVLFTLVLTFTNNSFDPALEQAWIENHGGADAIDYWHIAHAAPGNPDQRVPYQRAQRWMYPYLIGLIAYATAVDTWLLFHVLVLILTVVSIMLFCVITRHFVTGTLYTLTITALFAFNPYLFRFYLAFPGMLTDVVFVLGELIVLLALIKTRPGWVVAGLLIAVCARQTALALLPGILGFILSQSAPALLRRIAVCAVATIACVVVYWRLGSTATEFSVGDPDLRHLTGMVAYVADGFSLTPLAQHFGRWLFGFMLLFALLAAAPPGSPSGTSFWLLVIGSGVALQPLLAGPGISGGSVQRLAVLGLPALTAALLAAAARPSSSLSRAALVLAVPVIVAGSLHHNYSVLGPDPALRMLFVGLFIGSAAYLFFALRIPAGRAIRAP